VKTPGFVASDRKISTRKFVRVSELDSGGMIHDVFLYNQSSDAFQDNLEGSYLLAKMAKSLDVPLSVIKQEIERRKQILLTMVGKNLRDFRSVHKALSSSLNIAALDKTAEAEQ